MRTAKKWLAAFMALSMLTAFVACGGDTSTADPVSTPAEQTGGTEPAAGGEGYESLAGKTISFLTSQSKFFDEYNQMADAIEADYGVHVEFQVVPDNEYYTMLKVKLSTSEVPDVFEYNYPTQNSEIGAAQYCEDLSNEEWVSRLVNPDLLRDADDGNLYALPKESSSSYMAVYYNKAILADAGYENPNPATYQEFLDILQAVADSSEATPFYMTNADTWTTQIYMTTGIPIALGSDAESTFSALLANEMKWPEVDTAIDLLGQYKELIDAGYVNNDHLSVGYDSAAEAMGTGQIAMYLTIEQWAADMDTRYPDVELGAFVIPYNDTQKMATGAYVQGLFVPSSGSQVEEAKLFLDLWSQPQYQNLYFKSLPGFSAFSDVDGGEVHPAVQGLVDDYISTGNYVYQLNDAMSEASTVWTELWDYYVECMAGTKSPEAVFDSFQIIYEDYMAQQGYEGF